MEENRAYREIIILDKSTEEVIVKKREVGPIAEEDHLRETLIKDASKLKGIAGDDLKIYTKSLFTFVSTKEPAKKKK